MSVITHFFKELCTLFKCDRKELYPVANISEKVYKILTYMTHNTNQRAFQFQNLRSFHNFLQWKSCYIVLCIYVLQCLVQAFSISFSERIHLFFDNRVFLCVLHSFVFAITNMCVTVYLCIISSWVTILTSSCTAIHYGVSWMLCYILHSFVKSSFFYSFFFKFYCSSL